jgi:hypothetical protein
MRGRVTFTALGREHALHFTTNALCALEERSGLSFRAWAEKLQGDLSLRDMRLLFAVGVGVPEDEAGGIIDDVGVVAAGGLIGRAMTAAFGEAEPEAPPEGKPKAAA